jgi:hypothetical protein
MIKKEDIELIVSKSITSAISELQKNIESMVKAEVNEKTRELNETRLHLRKMLCHHINTTLNSSVGIDFFCFFTI